MSKSSDLDATVKRYIINAIDADGYGESPTTDAEKVEFLKRTFMAEYGWAVPRMGQVKALEEWFSGLPSACYVAFNNNEILALAVEWGSLPKDFTDAQADKILGNWWNLLANKTDQLFRKYVK